MAQPHSLRGIFTRPIADRQSLESSALIVGALAFVVAAGVAALLFWGRSVAIAGPASIGQVAAIGGFIAAFVTIIGARVLVLRSGTAEHIGEARLHWWDIGAIALAHGFIALLGWLAMASVAEMSFKGALVYSVSAMILVAVAIALTSYATFISAITLTPMSLSVVLAVFMGLGVFASMLSASDPLWWQHNLSSLGMTDDFSARAFNLTLIIGGALLTTIAHFATTTLPTSTPREKRGRLYLQVALTLIGIFLACVGIFPVDEYPVVHNLVAVGMAVIYVVTVIALRLWVPSMPRVFLLLGYVYVAVVVVLGIFFATGYYTLTAVELVAFVLIFSWVIVFLRNTASKRA